MVSNSGTIAMDSGFCRNDAWGGSGPDSHSDTGKDNSMTAQKGKDLLLKVDATGGGGFATVAGLR